jgi:hypothetical protein
MTVRRMISRVLAALVAAGLIFAPFVSPAMARSDHMAVAHGQHMSEAGAITAADMPCCPDQQKSDGCKDCPLMAICMLSVLQSGPSTVAIILRSIVPERLQPRDDVAVDGLIGPPPDRPPRTPA